MQISLRALAKQVLPPFIADLLRRFLRRHPLTVTPSGTLAKPHWEYSERGQACWDELPGWNVPSIVETQRQKWPAFVAAMSGSGPLGISHESPEIRSDHYSAHNTLFSFGYALVRAAHMRQRLSMLDWGGGAGQYAVIARALMPEIELAYTCKDLPLLCDLGRQLQPQHEFIDDEDAALARTYDFVYASSALHYSRDVYGTLKRLCTATTDWLMVTRQPVVEWADDFVVIQRPYMYGYHTEYPGWFLNRRRLIAFVEAQGFRLEREFLVDERPDVYNAPEQCRYGGFLFKRSRSSS